MQVEQSLTGQGHKAGINGESQRVLRTFAIVPGWPLPVPNNRVAWTWTRAKGASAWRNRGKATRQNNRIVEFVGKNNPTRNVSEEKIRRCATWPLSWIYDLSSRRARYSVFLPEISGNPDRNNTNDGRLKISEKRLCDSGYSHSTHLLWCYSTDM